jgi:acyl-CoA synthetase (AMP-forming)/AMP-acid ligase II
VLPPAVGEAFRSRFGIQVHQFYGMTETASLISVVGAHGHMVVTITLADGGESDEDLGAAAHRLLSGFSFDHRFIFQKAP